MKPDLKKPLEKTLAVTPDNIEVIADPEAEYEDGVLVGPNGTVRASNFYDNEKNMTATSVKKHHQVS